MVLSSSQQLVLLFTAALCLFVIFPRFFTGGSARENKALDPRFRKGPHPGPAPSPAPLQRGPPDSVQQVQRLMEQELRKEKAKISGNNKGYVFTLMPLYAIGVGLFAAYKFLKIKSADDTHTQKERTARGLRKSEETENQLNELEQRLAQTEKMLNSILTQLDPLTNCVKSVAMEQKNEIMTQLQCIRHLMKKRGMQYAPTEASCDRNLDNLIESLSAMETLGTETRRKPQTAGERDDGEESDCSMPSLEEEHGGGVGGATEYDKEMKEENDVGMATEEYDEDSYNEEQGGNMDEEEGVAEMCPNDLGAGLRKRNRHD
ncbi:coiled-coil domain-containing protein 107 isoform X2 [Hemibagrus wyckioides]|uniref:coiled-coil domain-containing protein 107 isoform X2 n=1 Tax=Hemibagrus wyckioides TaxID=337641 RepID=UPI00266CB129|nr:coiled-coil domain-containing protein 107 isoform X2 [Hemibagrus wyckioides]